MHEMLVMGNFEQHLIIIGFVAVSLALFILSIIITRCYYKVDPNQAIIRNGWHSRWASSYRSLRRKGTR